MHTSIIRSEFVGETLGETLGKILSETRFFTQVQRLFKLIIKIYNNVQYFLLTKRKRYIELNSNFEIPIWNAEFFSTLSLHTEYVKRESIVIFLFYQWIPFRVFT